MKRYDIRQYMMAVNKAELDTAMGNKTEKANFIVQVQRYIKRYINNKAMVVPVLVDIINYGNLELIKAAILDLKDFQDMSNDIKREVLVAMIQSGKVDVVKGFIVGYDCSIVDNRGRNVMHSAIKTAGHNVSINKEVLLVLQGRGVDLNERDVEGNTPFIVAAQKGDLNTCKALLEVDGDNILTYKDYVVNNILQILILKHCRVGIKELLEVDAKKELINGENVNGNTPLHLAALNGDSDLITLLIQKGADINVKNNDGKLPIELADDAVKMAPAPGYQDTVTQLLTQYKILMEQPDNALCDDRDLLAKLFKIALTYRNYCDKEVLDFFIGQLKADDINKNKLLHYLVSSWSPSPQGQEYLYRLSKENFRDSLKKLLKVGVDITAQDDDGKTILHYLAGDDECIKIIKAANLNGYQAALSVKDNDGNTALGKKDNPCQTLAEDFVARPDIKHKNGMNVLHIAAINRLMVDTTSNQFTAEEINKVDGEGFTPLDFAFASVNVKMIKYLIQNHAQTDKQLKESNSNKSYLPKSVVHVDWLLKYGVKPATIKEMCPEAEIGFWQGAAYEHPKVIPVLEAAEVSPIPASIALIAFVGHSIARTAFMPVVDIPIIVAGALLTAVFAYYMDRDKYKEWRDEPKQLEIT